MRPTGGFWYSVGCLWILGPWYWKPLAVWNSWLLLFPHLYHLYFFSLYLPCLCTEDIKYEHANNRHIRGGGEGKRACKVNTSLYLPFLSTYYSHNLDMRVAFSIIPLKTM